MKYAIAMLIGTVLAVGSAHLVGHQLTASVHAAQQHHMRLEKAAGL